MSKDHIIIIRVFFSLMAAGIIFLFPVLWLTQDLWDGVIISYAYNSLNPDIYDTWFDETGWPLVAEMYKWIYGVAICLGVYMKPLINIIIFMSVFLASYEVYRLSIGLFKFGVSASFCSALLFLACPGWNILISSVFLMHAVFIYLCLLGSRLYLLSPSSGVKAFGFLLILLSFQHAANPAIAFPLMVFYVVFYQESPKRSSYELALAGMLLIIGFFGFRFAFPAHGLYEGYNAIQIENFFKSQIYRETWDYYFTVYYPVVLLAAALMLYSLKKKLSVDAWQLVFMLVFIFISTLPYISVAKIPYSPLGWSSRFTLNTAIPIMFFLGFSLNLLERKKEKSWVLPLLLLTPVLSLSAYELLKGYQGKVRQIMHQAYFVKGFSQHEKPGNGIVQFSGWDQNLTRYENNYYLYLAYGSAEWDTQLDHTVFGDKDMIDYPKYKDKYALSDYEEGCLYNAIVDENISNSSSKDVFWFFVNQEKFMKKNKNLYFEVKDIIETSCKY